MPKPEKEKAKKLKTRRPKPYGMTDVDQTHLSVFLSTGRTGRRNALADVMDEKYVNTSSAGLPDALEGLCCTEEDKTGQKLDASSEETCDKDTRGDKVKNGAKNSDCKQNDKKT